MWKCVVINLGHKEGAWVQVDHELAFKNGNLEQTKKMLKRTQSKKIETLAKSICHKKDGNSQKQGSFKRTKVQEKQSITNKETFGQGGRSFHFGEMMQARKHHQ